MSAIAEMGGARGTTAASPARREAWLRRLPLLPAFIYVVLVTQIPFALTVYYSFFEWNLLKDNSFKFAGLANYARLVTDESLRIAVWNTTTKTMTTIGAICAGVHLSGPMDVALDPSRTHLYIADTLNGRVVRTGLDGSNCEVATTGSDVPGAKLGQPRYLTFAPDGRLLASASEDHTVSVWSLTDVADIVGRHATLTLPVHQQAGHDNWPDSTQQIQPRCRQFG